MPKCRPGHGPAPRVVISSCKRPLNACTETETPLVVPHEELQQRTQETRCNRLLCSKREVNFHATHDSIPGRIFCTVMQCCPGMNEQPPRAPGSEECSATCLASVRQGPFVFVKPPYLRRSSWEAPCKEMSVSYSNARWSLFPANSQMKQLGCAS